ncbi:MAG: YdcF family protein [Psychrilyobacter sp.]|nr:YdcF family protein [Psychrilyobacter sp.]
MFIIQKIISNIFISPGIFIIALLLILIFSLRKKRTLSRLLLIKIIILTYLLSIEPVKDMIIQPLEKKYNPITNEQLKTGDSYIVLGGGIYDNAPTSLGENTGIPSKSAMYKIVETVKLYKIYPMKIIISGGIVYSGEKSEGSVYKNLMISLGVPKNDIIVEGKSKTTAENARFTKEIMKDLKLKKAILVTSATHMNRSVYIFEKYGVEVIPNPTGYQSRYKESYGIESYLPNSYNFVAIRSAIWEYIGIIFYKFK